MSLGHPLDTLSARWADDPHPTACAALADGLRKRGDLRAALGIAGRGAERFPGHVPLWITMARVAEASHDQSACLAALAKALAIDPVHPVAREMALELAPELVVPAEQPETLYFAEPPDGEADTVSEDSVGPAELVTESLAALYHAQGHLAMALAAYSELAARDPGNASVAARHEAVRDEFAASQPVPFDARKSGGRPTRVWLAQLGTVTPDPRRPAEFDAFYDPPPAPPEAAADFGAFQRWLEELDK